MKVEQIEDNEEINRYKKKRLKKQLIHTIYGYKYLMIYTILVIMLYSTQDEITKTIGGIMVIMIPPLMMRKKYF